jgi:xanthine permease XanP
VSAKHFVRYEPQESPPHPLAAGLGLQMVVLIVTGVMVTPLVVARAAGLDAAQSAWLVFGALIASGVATWLQIMRFGIIGGGFVLFVGSNVAFVSVCVSALGSGGIPLMATLVCAASLFAFLFTWKMGALRRVLTPAVGGTVLMLMALSVAPVVWNMLKKVPPEFAGTGTPALVLMSTLLPIVGVSLFARDMLRLWAPLIGVVVGSGVAYAHGLIDTAPVIAAPWIGLPRADWPGLSLQLDHTFWALLPAFVLITMVGCIETYADGLAVQRASYREARPIDFRAVQGAINADGVGSFIGGLLGTVPNTVYSMSVGVMELTRVASRRVGLWGGVFLVLLAFSPKIGALVAALPSPVAGGYLLMILVLLFGHGVRMVTEEPLGFEAGVAVCLGFWVGVGFQGGFLFNELMPDWAKLFLANGTTSGGLTAILLMALLSLRERTRDKLTAPLDISALAQLRQLVGGFCKRLGWDELAENRLMLAAEESLLFLLENQTRTGSGGEPSQLHVRLRQLDDDAELEYICAPASVNVESAVAQVTANADIEASLENELSLRLLQGMTRELRHLQYHGTDYLLLRVDSSA